MRSFPFLRAASISLLTGAITMLAAPAHATIVVNGKTVSAWPDLEPNQPAPGIAFDVVGAPGIKLFPHPSGVVRGLTILVDFSDETGAYSKADIDGWLNTLGYNKFGLNGSIRDYYLKQSNGLVDYQNELYGFYRAKKTKTYYQGGSAYERADELWAEVISALDPEIDFSKFDNDHDGKTEAISLLYAGDEGTYGVGLWPHASYWNEKRDGVRVPRYMMAAMNEQPTNYGFAHESGHMLFGWPDLYGVGYYSIMANRGADLNPVGVGDLLRADQGWVDIVDISSTTNARYQATPNGVVYRYLNPARPTEYFLWSNVQAVGQWQTLVGGGLLVWHFDNSIEGNNPPQTLQLAIVQAGGTRQLSATQIPSPGSAKTDFFAQGVNTELGATTKPASKWNDGSASGLRIYDIGASSPSITFSVGVGPIPEAGAGGSGGVGGVTSAGAGGALAHGGSASAGSSGASMAGSSGNASAGASSASNGTAGAGGVLSAGGALNAGGALSAGGALGAGSAGSSHGAGFSGSAPAPGASADGEAGCSCSTAPRSIGSGAIAWGLAALALGASRRRRRQGAGGTVRHNTDREI